MTEINFIKYQPDKDLDPLFERFLLWASHILPYNKDEIVKRCEALQKIRNKFRENYTENKNGLIDVLNKMNKALMKLLTDEQLNVIFNKQLKQLSKINKIPYEPIEEFEELYKKNHELYDNLPDFQKERFLFQNLNKQILKYFGLYKSIKEKKINNLIDDRLREYNIIKEKDLKRKKEEQEKEDKVIQEIKKIKSEGIYQEGTPKEKIDKFDNLRITLQESKDLLPKVDKLLNEKYNILTKGEISKLTQFKKKIEDVEYFITNGQSNIQNLSMSNMSKLIDELKLGKSQTNKAEINVDVKEKKKEAQHLVKSQAEREEESKKRVDETLKTILSNPSTYKPLIYKGKNLDSIRAKKEVEKKIKPLFKLSDDEFVKIFNKFQLREVSFEQPQTQPQPQSQPKQEEPEPEPEEAPKPQPKTKNKSKKYEVIPIDYSKAKSIVEKMSEDEINKFINRYGNVKGASQLERDTELKEKYKVDKDGINKLRIAVDEKIKEKLKEQKQQPQQPEPEPQQQPDPQEDEVKEMEDRLFKIQLDEDRPQVYNYKSDYQDYVGSGLLGTIIKGIGSIFGLGSNALSDKVIKELLQFQNQKDGNKIIDTIIIWELMHNHKNIPKTKYPEIIKEFDKKHRPKLFFVRNKFKKYDKTEKFLGGFPFGLLAGLIPSALQGVSSIISAIKGNGCKSFKTAPKKTNNLKGGKALSLQQLNDIKQSIK